MSLSQLAINEVGRLLNGTNNPQHAAIGHLAGAAGRAAESLVYLADIDDRRFGGIWPDDGYQNDAVDDGHVRWASVGALTSLDLCIAAAARLGRFAQRSGGECSIRDFFNVKPNGTPVDKRDLVLPPWWAWIDDVIADARYDKLLRVRNALVHADALRNVYGITTGQLCGHSLRFGYSVGPLSPPVQESSHVTMMAREIVELSRDVALTHVGAFVAVLESIPRPLGS